MDRRLLVTTAVLFAAASVSGCSGFVPTVDRPAITYTADDVSEATGVVSPELVYGNGISRAAAAAVVFNPRVKHAIALRHQEKAKLAAAHAGNGPRIGLQASASQDDRNSKFERQSTMGAGLTGDYTVYDGGRRDAEVAAQEAAVKAGDAYVAMVANGVAEEAALAHLKVQERAETVKAAEERVALLEKFLAEATQGKAAGATDKSSVTRIEGTLSHHRGILSRARQDLLKAKAALAAATAERMGEAEGGEFGGSWAMPQSLNETIGSTSIAHPTLLHYTAKVGKAEGEAGVVEAGKRPTLGLSMAGLGYAMVTGGAGGLVMGLQSIVANMPLFDNGLPYRMDAAQAGVAAARYDADGAQLKVRQLVTDAWHARGEASKRVEYNTSKVTSREADLKASEVQFRAGAVKSPIAVLKDNDELYEAQVDLITAKYEAMAAEVSLLAATSRLTTALGITKASMQQQMHQGQFGSAPGQGFDGRWRPTFAPGVVIDQQAGYIPAPVTPNAYMPANQRPVVAPAQTPAYSAMPMQAVSVNPGTDRRKADRAEMINALQQTNSALSAATDALAQAMRGVSAITNHLAAQED